MDNSECVAKALNKQDLIDSLYMITDKKITNKWSIEINKISGLDLDENHVLFHKILDDVIDCINHSHASGIMQLMLATHKELKSNLCKIQENCQCDY